jgi:hypothetical protein
MFPKRTSVLIAMTIYNTKKEAGTLDSKDEKNHQDHMERKPIGPFSITKRIDSKIVT